MAPDSSVLMRVFRRSGRLVSVASEVGRLASNPRSVRTGSMYLSLTLRERAHVAAVLTILGVCALSWWIE